jgi:hypothetical protein
MKTYALIVAGLALVGFALMQIRSGGNRYDSVPITAERLAMFIELERQQRRDE